MSCFGGAITTITGAYIAQNHKSSRFSAPTLGFVWTSSTAANCMQTMLSNYTVNLRKSFALVESYLQPRGFTRGATAVIQLRHLKFIIFPIGTKILKNP